MAPKDSKKRKTNDSSESAKTSAVIEKKVESQQDSMSDDESADSLVEDSRSKMEKKELKELLKNYLIGRKLLNINIDMAKPKRHQLFDSLEEQGLVEVAKHKTVTIKSYRLTEKGINKATPPEFKEDMARTPKTDEDLHEIIKKYLYHPETGAKMFDILLEKTREHKTVAKKELAQMLGTNPSSPNFFYSLQQMKQQGYVHESEMKTLRLRKKAFVNGNVPFIEEQNGTQEVVKGEVEKSIVA